MAAVRRSARLSSGGASWATEAAKPTASTARAAAKAGQKEETVREERAAKAAPSRKRKAVAPSLSRPSTPPPAKKKSRGRPTTASAAPPPLPPSTPRPRHPVVDRLADPSRTNAPLISPETSRVVTSLPPGHSETAAAAAATATPVTTTNILEDACAHLLRVDPRLKQLVETHRCTVFTPEALAEQVDPFESLASSIISQQVSGAAARAIKGRFVALFDTDGTAGTAGTVGTADAADATGSAGREPKKRFPQPSQVAATSIERLRSAGLSQRKAEYVQGLAEKFVSGELSARLLADAPYETLVERLVAVRGLGLWTVEMFALFGLKRMDVFSVGDLGVQRGMAAYAGRDVAKLKSSTASGSRKSAKWKYMTDKEMLAIAEPFRPYRSVLMWYMWKVESVDVSAFG